jgi:non-specific serine/threonine protein kinase/serine/threonine-protein kinase
MSSDQANRAIELFEAALEKDEGERATLLDEACGEDAALRGEVEALLQADAEAGEFLEQAGVPTTQSISHDPATSILGQQIGRYKIRRLIATGGMGSVYEAQQDQPRRAVALKLMRRGIASRSALRRFEYEAQLLGRLRHPNIAQVYEAGTHDDGGGGVPYFAMEYIPRAVPITDYAVANKLTIAQRLDLFLQVCDAVHHGHQKGIIHRDLKPSNILVDSAGQPKIIDFGVARSTDSDMALTTIQTSVGQLIGTLQYMSPEQCEADPHDIDTRSDVYALGVVLYELLSDKLPYDVGSVAIHAATLIIREQMPSRLSTINRTLRGDVETIALKALEKDRSRRYQSAAELAQEINRYLTNQPITARPPSVIYQMRTFARRNRAVVGAIAAVFVALICASTFSTYQYFNATAEAESAKAINDYFNKMLTSLDLTQLRTLSGLAPDQLPLASTGRDFGWNVSVAEAMRQAGIGLEETFARKPLMEASVRETIGMTLKGLGLEAEARPHLQGALDIRRRILGDDHEDTWRSILQFASHDFMSKLLGGAVTTEPLVRRAFEGMRQRYGDEDPRTLTAQRILANWQARQGNREASYEIFNKTLDIQRRVLGAEHRDILMTMCDWSSALWNQNNPEGLSLILEALAISRRTLRQHDYISLYAQVLTGAWQWRIGRLDLCGPLFEDFLDNCRRAFGENHPWTYFAMRMVAGSWHQQDDRQLERERLYRTALAGQTKLHGQNHFETHASRGFLGWFLLGRGELDEGIELAAVWPHDRPKAVFRQLVFEYQLRCAGRTDEARQVLEKIIPVAQEIAQRDDASAAQLNSYARLLLACVPRDLRDPHAARSLSERAAEISAREHLPYILNTLALSCEATGDLDRAIETQREALAALPPGEWWPRTDFEMTLLTWLLENGDVAAAEALLLDSVQRVRDAHGEVQARLVWQLTDLLLHFRIYEFAVPRAFALGGNTGARRRPLNWPKRSSPGVSTPRRSLCSAPAS